MKSIATVAVIVAVTLLRPTPHALCAGAAAETADAKSLPSKEEVGAAVGPLIEGEYCRSLVVGLVNEHGARVYGFGRLSADDPTTPGGDTVYEIGSITKAFTGVLLAEMVGRGEVALDDPVQKHLPDSVKLTRGPGGPGRGKPITLDHLATHRSGLPRMPGNFAPKDPANPFADYTVEQLHGFVTSHKLAREPGESYEYSNLGYGLLGYVMARSAGADYEQLLIGRVCEPLNMRDTFITLDDARRNRRAPGHDADGNPQPDWDFPTLPAGGALRSTANDMLAFLSAHLEMTDPPPDVKLAEAMRLARTPRARADGDNDIGLGWHVNTNRKAVWHNGHTGGYHSFAAFVPEKKVGVVVLSNTATGHVDAVGSMVLGRMLGEPSVGPPPLRKPVAADPNTFDAYVGEYPLSPFLTLTVTRDGDRLMVQATGQDKFRVYPESEHKFFYKVVDEQITFDPPVDGKCPRLVLHQNGQHLPGPRKP